VTTRFPAALALALIGGAGCALLSKHKPPGPVPEPATFSQYHLDGWSWAGVDRILVLPFLNESQYTRAGDEVRLSMATELERVGRFEVVGAPADERAALAVQIHRGGRFDEAAMLDLAHATKADVVVHGIITQYSPYPRPRIGLVVQAVGPQQAKVVASVEGLWDTTDPPVAERCRAYYRQCARERPPFVRNNKVQSADDGLAVELALESPALFQRWVCHEVVLALLGQKVPYVISSEPNSRAAVAAGGGAAGQTNCPAPAPAAPAGNVK
jgi:hypothetical protein